MFRMRNGKHAGLPINQVPVGYLRWMVNAGHGDAEHAIKEMERRGTTVPTIEVSGHAIDRASQRLLGLWITETKKKVGLHSWLCRKAEAALRTEAWQRDKMIEHGGVRYYFASTEEWPVVKTVSRSKENPHGDDDPETEEGPSRRD